MNEYLKNLDCLDECNLSKRKIATNTINTTEPIDFAPGVANFHLGFNRDVLDVDPDKVKNLALERFLR